jgi:hypothetical protein
MKSSIRSKIQAANEKTVQIMLDSWDDVLWIGNEPAIDVVPGMGPAVVLHAGPPIPWERMCPSMREGVIGGVLFEGLAGTREEAIKLVESGQVKLTPAHEHRAVGGMTGITTASMPMHVVLDKAHGVETYCRMHERKRALQWGEHDEQVLQQMRWMTRVLGPLLSAAVKARGGLPVKAITARALQMGDECHNRNVAATSLLVREMLPYLTALDWDKKELQQAAHFLREDDGFYLHIDMAAGKAIAEAAKGIEYSTIVTTIARNGVEVGIRVSGLGDQWFTGPAGMLRGSYAPGFGDDDVDADMGDSAIMETMGLGGQIQAAAPVFQQIVGGTLQDAINHTREMMEISFGRNPAFVLPVLDFEAGPLGIDVLKVLETGITPLINSAMAAKKGGFAGAGQVRVPMDCFAKAFRAFAQKYEV